MAKKKPNKLVFGNENQAFNLSFEHSKLADLPKNFRSEFQMAVDRFGSLMVESVERMNHYEHNGGHQLDGVRRIIECLLEANRLKPIQQ